MVETRRIVARHADFASEADEPLLDIAKRKVAQEGGSLRAALRSLREERRERARQIALADAPASRKNAAGEYQRVSSDPRWPWGIDGELVVAPFGLSECGLPRTVDPEVKRNGPRANVSAAKREARDHIIAKLNKMGCDPIEIIAEIAMDREGVEPQVRLRAAAELSHMIYPKLRGVESVQREEKTIFVIGVPDNKPADAADWLSNAEGAKRIRAASETAATAVIEGELVSTKDE